jgi:zinc D-Ala-D-Ala carboxypeptidase
MTTRHLRPLSAALVAFLATVLTVTGTAGPASAAVPSAAQTWASLMYHSLTPSPAYVKLRKTLADQRATMAMRATRVTTGRAAHATAQTDVTAAVTADAAARTRYALAREDLASARNRLTVATQQRPRNAAAVTRARNAVLAVATTTSARRVEAATAAATLKAAQAAALTTTTDLDSAITALASATETVRTSQLKLVALDNSAELARQAAATSRSVVSQVRPVFTTADTTAVYGITVHKSVAFAFRRMIDDAKADGISLSGGGFRTRQRQIELRKINGCPDVWTAPASSCRVPTAIPGKSLHEIGLAVDITSGGKSLTRSSAGFKWLAANAADYGYVNLPSEAWHWSITGG